MPLRHSGGGIKNGRGDKKRQIKRKVVLCTCLVSLGRGLYDAEEDWLGNLDGFQQWCIMGIVFSVPSLLTSVVPLLPEGLLGDIV